MFINKKKISITIKKKTTKYADFIIGKIIINQKNFFFEERINKEALVRSGTSN